MSPADDDLRALEPPTSEARPCPRCATAMVPLTRSYTTDNGCDTDPLVPSFECRACHFIVAAETLRGWDATVALTREAQARGEYGDAVGLVDAFQSACWLAEHAVSHGDEKRARADRDAARAALIRALAAPVRDAAGTGTDEARDAARYRWLRDHGFRAIDGNATWTERHTRARLDAYVDMAMHDETLPEAPAPVAAGMECTNAEGHLFAEHSSRYDLRCVRCGVKALELRMLADRAARAGARP